MRRRLIELAALAAGILAAGCNSPTSPSQVYTVPSAPSSASGNAHAAAGGTSALGPMLTPPEVSCTTLSNTMLVAADGSWQADGSLLAAHVAEVPSTPPSPPTGLPSPKAGLPSPPPNLPPRDKLPPPPQNFVHGVVSDLSGTCPSLMFTVAGSRVTTTAATKFVRLF